MNPILNRTGNARRDVEVRRRRRTSQCRSTHDRGMAWTDRGTRCGVCGQNCDDEEDVVVIVVEFRRCLSQAAKRAVEDTLNDRKHYPKPVPAHTERRTEERMKGTPSREGQASQQEITKEDKHEHLEGDKASIFVIPKRRYRECGTKDIAPVKIALHHSRPAKRRHASSLTCASKEDVKSVVKAGLVDVKFVGRKRRSGCFLMMGIPGVEVEDEVANVALGFPSAF
ncbi:uncharacterized protein MYCGRDRAFT_97883 [Zymoseptoria tritici IPO323]|uniref:Uncharacterized protein n=1 Tax=Zymoseptoria tritici (strain CBS 115943 / IPO323) TaxID=336722 RepID=F9XRN9_ZYMTI|nr:uncharacterized protein MYCGRDRAFT_97883 [Zymoseptoria tritici IPO323]EGP82067.1 hypothetical protein MYCGRDRAFT_97883 [Zymoseptoria tritici IPO323]